VKVIALALPSAGGTREPLGFPDAFARMVRGDVHEAMWVPSPRRAARRGASRVWTVRGEHPGASVTREGARHVRARPMALVPFATTVEPITCDCEPDPYPPEEEGENDEPCQFLRTCARCGEQWFSNHCPHDRFQGSCPGCGLRPQASS